MSRVCRIKKRGQAHLPHLEIIHVERKVRSKACQQHKKRFENSQGQEGGLGLCPRSYVCGSAAFRVERLCLFNQHFYLEALPPILRRKRSLETQILSAGRAAKPQNANLAVRARNNYDSPLHQTKTGE
jgi:hypothetical protein